MFLLVLVPFFFIFMLKDHEKLAPFVYGFFTGKQRVWVKKTLSDIDNVLRSYIQGQLLISFLLAILLFIGYSVIGLKYALLLAIFGLFMNLIPFIGPWIAVAPAIVIAFVTDPTLVIWVGVITIAAQQIESNLITPNVMGKSLIFTHLRSLRLFWQRVILQDSLVLSLQFQHTLSVKRL